MVKCIFFVITVKTTYPDFYVIDISTQNLDIISGVPEAFPGQKKRGLEGPLMWRNF